MTQKKPGENCRGRAPISACHRGERGQAALFITMTLTLLIGLIGFVVDFGWAYFRQLGCATAANSAAIAAIVAASRATNQSCGSGTSYWNCTSSYSCPSSLTPGTIASDLDNGCLYANQNGFSNAGRQTVTLSSGSGAPASMPGTSSTYYVTATVTERIPTLFTAVLGQPWMNVTGHSTAAIIASGGCIYVLDPTDSGSLSMTGTASLSSGCGIYVNSNASGAISMVGTSQITTTSPATTQVVGTVSSVGGASISPAAVQVPRRTPADPFAGNMPAVPPTGACQPTAQFTGSGTNTISQGTYCDTISQKGSGTLILGSGTYYLENGITSAGSSTVEASGPVTLYIANGGISFAGSGGVAFSAPTTGTYQGIAIWQPSGNNTAATIVGTSTQTISGLIYMPSAALTYTGTSNSTVSTLAVYTLRMVGTSNLKAAATTPWAGIGPGGNYIIQ